MDYNRHEEQQAFLSEVDKVKSVFSNTLLPDTSRPVNDTEQSWHHMLICTMLLAEYFGEPVSDVELMQKMKEMSDNR